jgi:ABC-2 type transport system permease protein
MLARLRFEINPIIVKELRSRMRDTRAFIILTAMLLLLGSSSYLLYRLALTTSSYSSAPLSPQIGQTLFIALAFLELMVVCAIAPAITAGAISSEQEKQTYEMLLATPLHPASILWGKLVSALSYVFLLIFAAIPMASLIFIFGGVTLRDMLKALIVLIVVAVTLGIIGLFLSSWLGRTSRATVISYLVVVALIAGPLIAYIAVGILRQAEPPRWILVLNPLSALFSALTPSPNTGGSFSSNLLWTLGIGLGGNMGMLSGTTISLVGIPRPLYHYSLPLYGAISLVLYLLSTRLVRPTRRWKVTRWEALFALALLLVFAGAVGLAFLSSADRYENAGTAQADLPSAPEPSVQGFAEPVKATEETIIEPEALPPTTSPYPVMEQSELGADFEMSDSAMIYAAIVREFYTVDHTYNIDDPPNFPVIYLIKTTDDATGDPNAPQAGRIPIPEEIQKEVSERLSGAGAITHENRLPAEIIWVETVAEVPLTSTNSVEDGGAVITLGNIYSKPDGSVLVSASLYLGELAATGKTYILERFETEWRIIGSTGVQWTR